MSGQLELAELDSSRARLMEAEMRALRAQISPHFVYNSLTTIASFVRTDPERARELLLDFADFARYSLPRAARLHHAGRGAALDRPLPAAGAGPVRRPAAVQPSRSPPRCCRSAVPFLSLQPLVENAIRHGMECGGSGSTSDRGARRGAEARSASRTTASAWTPSGRRVLAASRRGGRRRHRPAQRGRAAAPGLRRGVRPR